MRRVHHLTSLAVVLFVCGSCSVVHLFPRAPRQSWESRPLGFKAAVQFVVLPPRPHGFGAFETTIHFSDGLRKHTVRNRDFRTLRGGGMSELPWYETRPEGILAVTAALEREPGDTLGTGHVKIPIRADRG